MERELKLRIAPEHLDALRDAPLLAHPSAATAPRLLTTTYFDTPELAVHRCGASLRVRLDGDRRTQTLKLERLAHAGVFNREEFEMPADGDSPDLARLHDAIPADTDCGKLVRDEAVADSLTPMFVTRINRTAIALRLAPNDDEIEVAIDEGTIEAKMGSISIAGVELELKRGNPESLLTAALELLKSVPLHVDRQSKADSGYGLLMPVQLEAVKAMPVRLGKGGTVEAAFCTILHNCLDQVHANERGVVSGHDPSCVHQMRVGLRRLRSALDLFGDVIPAYPGLDDELRWIAAELGAARDWEVLAGSTLERAGADSNAEELQPVRQACTQMALDNRGRAATAVESVRYTQLVLQLTRWLDGKRWREAMTGEQLALIDGRANEFAARVLDSRHRKLMRRGRKLADLDDERRHRARIAAKKVRYATEFFASLLPKSAVRHYVRALTALQDDLGWRHDAVVAASLLDVISGKSREAAVGAAFARGYLASRVAADRRTLKKLWKRFKRLSPPH